MESLNSIQRSIIEEALSNTWNDIYDHVLTKDQKDKKGRVLPEILYEVEGIFDRFATNFGLDAIGYKD